MNGIEAAPVLVTGFLAGLLGSGHCFGMCGGIAGTLGALANSGNGRRWLPGLLFNLGRISSYVVLGMLTAWAVTGAGEALNVPHWARALRLITAIMIGLIGLRLLFDLRLLDRIEQAGAGLWRLVQPAATRISARPGLGNRLLLGACWGLLPCGLVYSIILTAASTGRPLTAAVVMLAFGIGTLPSMLGATWLSPMLGALMRDRTVRRIVGVSLILLAAWTIAMMTGKPHTMMH
jgi:sulfite exporter TauE/SafE